MVITTQATMVGIEEVLQIKVKEPYKLLNLVH
jgi:hypothetical protein